ncbi:biopolymer transporter ExbD [Silanimonas lenta]|uniref:biopolymer transporter ExbD n=1 Tax=Silanimonas lenta TaxID=265429 RepID=UPI0004047DD4|nr:biopolymer transporter ExbD [Silanimonas lenta]
MALRLASDREELALAHEMNVTPFIDVMLVLLIIFMVAAPLSTVELDVDLPASRAAPAPRPEPVVVLTLPREGGWRLGGRALDDARLAAALREATGGDTGARIHLGADRTVPYERLMAAMDALREAGYTRVALVGLEAGKAR